MSLKLKDLQLFHGKKKMSFTLFAMQKQKTKSKPEVFNFSAIHLIHDPQGKHALYFVFIQVMC